MDMSQFQEVVKVFEYLATLRAYWIYLAIQAGIGFVFGLIPAIVAWRKGLKVHAVQFIAACIFSSMAAPMYLLIVVPLSFFLMKETLKRRAAEEGEEESSESAIG
jgi:hypothetical protein